MAFVQRIGRAVLELTTDSASYDAGIAKAKAGAKDLSRSWASLGGDASVISRQIGSFTKDFSGSRLMQSANSMAIAVSRLGGATKLTAAEQARLNATLTQAIEKYRALGQQAPKVMLDLAQATKKVEQPTSLLTTKMVALGAAIGSFAGNLAVGAVQRLGQSLLRAASDGAKLTAITTGFQRLAAGIGQSGDAMLMVTRSATKGLISDLDLMQSANKAILLGLPVTAHEMATLSKAAVTLGRAMGLDATTSLDNLVTALGRSSPLILDNLGLTVKVGEANEAYARSLGKLPSQLTDAEQKMAFYRAAMDAALRKTEELGDVQLGVIDQLSRIGTAVANMATTMASGANQSKTFAGSLGEIADEADRATRRLVDMTEAMRRSNPTTGVGIRREFLQIEADRMLALVSVAQQKAADLLKTRPVMLGPKPPTAAEIKALEDASEQLQQRFKELVALGNSVFGRDVIQRAHDLASVIGNIGNVSKLSEDKQKEVNVAVTEAIAVYERLGQTAPQVLTALAAATDTVVDKTKEASRAAAEYDIFLAERLQEDTQRTQKWIAEQTALEIEAIDARLERKQEEVDTKAELDDEYLQSVREHENFVGELVVKATEERMEAISKQRQEAIDFWKRQATQLESATIGRLGTLFFGNLGKDINGQLKAAADEAQQDFLRIQRSGKATAEELTLAMRRWREAEDRANVGFGERWKQFWGGIQQTFVSILDDMLQHFLKQFIGGMLRGMANARLGQSVAGLIPGIGGGGAGAFGIGAAGAAVPTGITAPGGAAAGGAGGGAGFLSNPAFWTNPYTIAGIAGAALLTWAITKKGLFRGGEEALKVSPKRDQFFGQLQARFGGSQFDAAAKAFASAKVAGDRAQVLISSLYRADSLKEWTTAQAAAVSALTSGGVRGLKSFAMGGFVPRGVVQPAILHGPELIVPLDGASSTRTSPVDLHQHYSVAINVTTPDWDGWKTNFDREILPALHRELRSNQRDTVSLIKRVVAQ